MTQVMTVAYAKNGQECVGECGQQGEVYWWCHKSKRWTGKYQDAYWDYCSPDATHTRCKNS